MSKTKVIFLCTHNSVRSQMAEAFLRKYGGDYFEVYSAGFDPKPIHPYTFKVMQEIGYDLSGQQPKELWPLIKNTYFGIAITVCRKVKRKIVQPFLGCPQDCIGILMTQPLLKGQTSRNLLSSGKLEIKYRSGSSSFSKIGK